MLPALLAHAQADPIASLECREARVELQQALNGSESSRSQPSWRLTRARKQVQATCLGPSEGARQRAGASEPALAVAPPRITQNPATPLAQPEPALAIPRPTVITTCDPSGCWDSEGRRLNNAGPTLMGPRGQCSGSGSVIICP